MRPPGGGAERPPPPAAAHPEADGTDGEWSRLLDDEKAPGPVAESSSPTGRAAAAVWRSGAACILLAALAFAFAAALVKLAIAVQPGLTIYEASAAARRCCCWSGEPRASLSSASSAPCTRFRSSAVPSHQVIVVRSVLAMLASLGVSRAKGMPLLGRWRHVHLLATRGLFGAASMTCFYATLQRIPLGETVLLMFLNPMFCAAIAWVLLHEHVGWRTAIG